MFQSRIKFYTLIILALLVTTASHGKEIAITFDDPRTSQTPLLSWKERNERILSALKEFGICGALFVCGRNIDDAAGKELIQSWDRAGHLIGNHSYSHFNFNSSNIPLSSYIADFEKNEPLVTGFRNFQKLFRFPYLKEGGTVEKRDGFRAYLAEHNYKNGGVTIDASDWYVSQRMSARLSKNFRANISGYRDFYLQHIWGRMQYYDQLSSEILHRDVKHTLLLHHNLLNALFLKDLLKMIRSKGWKLVDAKTAFSDPIFSEKPKIIPAGESCVWAVAKASGLYKGKLRYPGEDGEYEKTEMDKLGL